MVRLYCIEEKTLNMADIRFVSCEDYTRRSVVLAIWLLEMISSSILLPNPVLAVQLMLVAKLK